MTLGSRGLVTSRDKLKLIYLYYHNIYGHKTLQAGDLPSVDSTHNFSPPISHVVLRDRVTYYKDYIFTATMSIATKLGRMMTYPE